jgi:hypothetical protein
MELAHFQTLPFQDISYDYGNFHCLHRENPIIIILTFHKSVKCRMLDTENIFYFSMDYPAVVATDLYMRVPFLCVRWQSIRRV